MVIVAIVAFTFATAFELKNHAEQDRLLRRQLNRYKLATGSFSRALECQHAIANMLPQQVGRAA